MTKTRRDKVAAAVKAVKDFHALGRAVPPKPVHKDAYGQGQIDAEAAARGVNADMLRKARAFADPIEGYSPTELKELCRVVTAVQPDQDDRLAVFGRTHVIRLLSVPKLRRAALQKVAIIRGWSTAELEAEIAARFGSRRGGGRRRRVPSTPIGLLVQLERLCESWRRWAAVATLAPHRNDTTPSPLGMLSATVRKRVRTATAGVADLHHTVADELARHKPGRTPRVVEGETP